MLRWVSPRFSHPRSSQRDKCSMVEASACSGMAESDITAMKETLRAQQQLLQRLYTELDEERESSATAASEAMDMILRLQGEKAAVKMEASHYKRMAEEKIGHAEATLEFYEELMVEKEMEIASLEYQIMAYKQKLLHLGYDFNPSEFEFQEDLLNGNDHQLFDRMDQPNGENGQCSSIRRLSSLPTIRFKTTWRAALKRERSPSPVSDVIQKNLESSSDHEVASTSSNLPRKSEEEFADGTLDSYWNQIKRLDEKVKEISDCKDYGEENCGNLRSRRGRSSTNRACDQTGEVNHSKATQDREAVANHSCSVNNVHDVFEVPQTSAKHAVNEHGKRRLEKWVSEADNRLKKPDSMSEELVESHGKHDMDKLKSMLSAPHEVQIPIIWQKKEGMDVNCNAQAEFQKLHHRIEQLERERFSIRQEITHEGDREEQLRLLKNIYSQVKLIRSEMTIWKTKNAAPKENVHLDSLQEAMLYFWI